MRYIFSFVQSKVAYLPLVQALLPAPLEESPWRNLGRCPHLAAWPASPGSCKCNHVLFHTPKHSHVMCFGSSLKKNKTHTYSKLKGLAQEMRWKLKKNRFIPCVCLFREQPNHMQSTTWHYPCGSFFFQLARTALACVRIGGSPKRCDISQYGTARLCGSFWRDD